MILKRQNMSENKWNHFKIVPQGHHNCQLSIVNCQFGEAAKFQFIEPQNDTERVREKLSIFNFQLLTVNCQFSLASVGSGSGKPSQLTGEPTAAMAM